MNKVFWIFTQEVGKPFKTVESSYSYQRSRDSPLFHRANEKAAVGAVINGYSCTVVKYVDIAILQQRKANIEYNDAKCWDMQYIYIIDIYHHNLAITFHPSDHF